MAASMEAMDVAALTARLRDEVASRVADDAAAAANSGARDPGAAAAAWRPLLGTLRSLTAAFVHPANREATEPALFDCLGQLLEAVTAPVRAGGAGAGSDRAELEVAGECFRCLRNACVQCPANQRRVREAGLINAVAQLLLAFPPPPSAPDEPYFTAARCGLQVLGNVAAGNADTREAVWAATYPQLYLKFLQCGDAKTLDYSCMALHTCAGPAQVARLACDPPGVLIARALLALCSRPHLEWPLLMVTERFLKSSTLLAQLYEHLDLKLRLTLLELLLASLAEESPSASAEATTPAPAPFLMRLADELRTTGPAVLRLASLCAEAAAGDEEALLVARTLSVLCEATSEPRGDSCLRDHPTLLAAAVGARSGRHPPDPGEHQHRRQQPLHRAVGRAGREEPDPGERGEPGGHQEAGATGRRPEPSPGSARGRGGGARRPCVREGHQQDHAAFVKALHRTRGAS
ncbi:ataxin-10 isoform X2 [Lampetra fluviatilis]